MFRTPIDVCNRALQHIGAPRISSTLGFTESSPQAAECSFVYDKLRRAELQRNTWTFATKRVVLRPIASPIIGGPGFAGPTGPQTPSMFLSPAMYDSTKTYYPGQIVSDASGVLWLNNTPDNKNNTPGSSSTWEQYFGPLSVEPFDPTITYYAGEIVYNTIGDGVFRVFASLIDGNADNPTIATLWGSTTYYFKDEIVIFYPAWAGGTTYAAGAAVSYTDGNYYASLVAGNVGNTPSTSPTKWVQIPLPPSATPTTFSTAIAEWDPTVTYSLGNFIDYGGNLYVSIVATNLNLNPVTNSSSWAPVSGGTLYLSLIDANLNNEPDLSPVNWASGTTYATGNKVNGSDNNTYTSKSNGNIGHDPTADGGVHWTLGGLTPWTSTFTGGSGSNQFMTLTTALTDASIFYPVGSGPVSQVTTKNVFRLPANFLRKAPTDPKAGSFTSLGAPTNMQYEDWIIESDYIVAWHSGPLLLRFVTDIVDVTKFHDMFCEGLACRIGLEICEKLTQSTAKTQLLGQMYQKFMTEARTINAIETGAEEPPLDDYLAVRA